ncbi:uncharacterized protein LOC110686330 [Chenopodium quinoa]|uniref:uncharacterized protein LOC110686330 n=1 Tax=Chenopodium quinoa TaxID=63459 RepID=UPI000B798394|nr:uncharacterized protein LOC110686330 [Chenopodium quinoa]
MDPNNPNFRQQFSGFSDDYLTNPEFQLFLQRMGNTSLQPPPQHQTPTEFPQEHYDNNEERTPETDHGSNTQFDDSEEENVPETLQYPPQISEDAIKGTSQKATDLWRNVHAAYQMAHAEKPHILSPRPMKSLSSHWRRLAADTLQWISCYDEADPKWRPKLRWSLSKKERKAACHDEEQGSARSGKRSRDDVGDETPTDGFSSGGVQRPDGVKKVKAKCKGKAVATESGSSDLGERMKEFATIHEREAILKEERIKIEKDKEQRKREELDIHKMRTVSGFSDSLLSECFNSWSLIPT